MKRIMYTLLITICGVLLHGAIYSADVAPPESSSSGNIAQPSDTERKPDGVPAEQPSEEIQERAVKPSGPTLKVPPQLLPPITPMTLLPGEFAIRTRTMYFLTAVGGGGRTTDAFHTDLKDASKIGAWEKFKLLVDPGPPRSYAIQTASGHYVTAVGGGGQSSEPVLQTDRTQVQAWEKFNLFQNYISYPADFIRVSTGHYVTAVNSGGQTTNVLRTDSNQPMISSTQEFRFYKCGDPGPDSTYAINWSSSDTDYYPIVAPQGGGLLHGAILVKGNPGYQYGYGTRFRLLRQSDGSYALQTENGKNYVTVVGGVGTSVDPVLQTNQTQVLAWEKFRLWVMPDCTYAFQTAGGHWLGIQADRIVAFSTNITAMNKFRLLAAGLDPLPGSHRGAPGGVIVQ